MEFGWWSHKDNHWNDLYNPPNEPEIESNYVCWYCGKSKSYCLCTEPFFVDIPPCIQLPPLFCNEEKVDGSLNTLAPTSENSVLHASSSHELFKVDNLHDSKHVDCDLMMESVCDLECEPEFSEKFLNEKSIEQGEVEEEGSFELVDEKIQTTIKEVEEREDEQEVKIDVFKPSPLLEKFENLGEVELLEWCNEPTGYILEFELAPILQYPSPPKKFMSKLGIVLKRRKTKMRRKFPLIFSKTNPWDTFVWDPGGILSFFSVNMSSQRH